MKVLVVADVPAGADSGAAGTEYQTVAALRALRCDVETIWADGLSHRIAHGNLHSLIEQPLSYRRAILRRLATEHFDIVHANQPAGYLTARALRDAPIAFIHRSHGFEGRVADALRPWLVRYGSDRRPLLRRALGRPLRALLARSNALICRYADGHIVSARECRDYLRDRMGVPDERIAVIPQAPPPSSRLTLSLGMTAERLRHVLYVGQFAFFKAPMIVASAMAEIADAEPVASFTWVCSRTHHEHVRRLCPQSLRPRLVLVDWMSQDSLREVYDRHGILLFPSFFEGFGKVFLEGMARGVCVVASDMGGPRDVISNGIDGLLVPKGSIQAIVHGCLDLMQNAGLAERMSAAAVVTADRYTWERAASETLAFYRHVSALKTAQVESILERPRPVSHALTRSGSPAKEQVDLRLR